VGPFLILLGTTVAFMIVATLGLRRYVEAIVRRVVERRHREASYILETGLVPERWGRGPASRRRRRRLLRDLVAYFEGTPLVDGPETRQQILDGLRRAGSAWGDAVPRVAPR
jgi:hypothetical protein